MTNHPNRNRQPEDVFDFVPGKGAAACRAALHRDALSAEDEAALQHVLRAFGNGNKVSLTAYRAALAVVNRQS